jgi:8-amino-7-oxononanoate synthase
MNNIEQTYQDFLKKNLYPRKLQSLESIQGFSFIHLQKNGRKIINFSSSDYLGLATHPLLIERSKEYATRFGVGVSASRLVTGNLAFYTELEQQLATALGKPAALIFGSGYQTNQAVLTALLDPHVLGHEPLVFCDKLSHASILAGTTHLNRIHRFQHNDLMHLQKLLQKYAQSDQQKFILVESLYSMDGDVTELEEIIKIAEEYHAFLYVDDAHAVGVYGHGGWGQTAAYAKKIPVIMGTFSKALGSFGGYIACSESIKHYLINKCRGFIYSTGLSPAVLGAISAAIELLPTLDDSRQRVINLSNQVRAYFTAENLAYGTSSTHIIPWIIGDAKTALYVSELLEEQGILGTAIQPPSVPKGKSRIRFCLSSAHSDDDIVALFTALSVVKKKLPLVQSPVYV